MNGLLTKFDLVEKKNLMVERFPSREAFFKGTENRKPVNLVNEAHLLRLEEEAKSPWRLSWFGASSIEEILEIGRGGWKKGLQMYYDLKSQIPIDEIAINSGFQMKRKRRVYGEEGGDIDVCRYINKEYDTMFIDKRLEKVKEGRYITIWTSPYSGSRTAAGEIIWRGISAVVLTDILENAGYRVCLKMFGFDMNKFVNDGDKGYAIEILLKNFNEQLDIESCLLTGGSSVFLRYYLLRHFCFFEEEVMGHFGFPLMKVPSILAGEGDITLGDLGSLNSKESAIKTIIKILQQLNERGKIK